MAKFDKELLVKCDGILGKKERNFFRYSYLIYLANFSVSSCELLRIR